MTTKKDFVPPNIQKLLENLFQRSKAYNTSLKWLDGAAQVEATIRSVSDGNVLGHLFLSRNYHRHPTAVGIVRTIREFPAIMV